MDKEDRKIARVMSKLITQIGEFYKTRKVIRIIKGKGVLSQDKVVKEKVDRQKLK